MSRLIDAGLLLDHLSGRLESMKDYDAIKDVVNNMPTAYDVDKVVEQLEEKAELAHEKCTIYPVYNPLYDRYDTQYQELKSCLEIVKGGIVDE